jgi:hydroxyacylglutathione hydrolase
MEKPMSRQITTFCLPLPYCLGSVNCYLLKNESGYLLIDTGSANRRTELTKELENAGCRPGALKLIVITHGDFDHTGNAAYLRQKFGAKIAMHAGDAGMLEHGDMTWKRNKGNVILRRVAPILFRFGKSERCKPDFYLDDGDALTEIGFDARVIALPGHSTGSIGILAAVDDPATGPGLSLFCGDLLENTSRPALGSIMDDLPTARASFTKLKGRKISTIYPGHGLPFSLSRMPLVG